MSHFKNELLLNYFRLQSLLYLHETLFYMMMLFDTCLTDHVLEHKPLYTTTYIKMAAGMALVEETMVSLHPWPSSVYT